MEFNGVIESLKHKSFLITGSTGFLAKIFVEKILRVQPNVKKMFLLIRAKDTASATQRLHNEVMEKQLFQLLQEKHGENFTSFVKNKVTPVAGDIMYDNLGVKDADLIDEMWKEVNVVVNFAATTKFDDRYDVTLNINTLGAKNVLDFAKKCVKIEMFLHVSTGYVCGTRSGLILEKPLKMGEALNGVTGLNIEEEVKLVEKKLNELKTAEVGNQKETDAMKDLGLQRARFYGWPNTYVFTKAMGEMVIGALRGELPVVVLRPTMITSTYKEPFPGWIEGLRTIDSMALISAKGKLTCSVGDPETIADMIPGDMVVNAMIVAITKHSNQSSEYEIIYQVGSAARNPITVLQMIDIVYKYFSKKPLINKRGNAIKVNKIILLTTMTKFQKHVDRRYRLPLKVLRTVNFIFFQYFRNKCSDIEKKINLLLRMMQLYKPFLFFKGILDDSNTEKLQIDARMNEHEANIFYFDPKCINWDDYFINIHFPGLVLYVAK